MKKVVVLGAGLIGRAIALDLATEYQVTVVDVNDRQFSAFDKVANINPQKADLLSGNTLSDIIKGCDLVVGAMPSKIGYRILETVVRAGKNMVDISFFTEDAFALDDLAREKGVTAIVDCGVAPGTSNLILGYHDAQMTVKRFTFYVGGLPRKRTWPFEYKAPFAPLDVIEEYIRPARIMVNGRIVEKAALSEPELLDFENVGTLEAFYTDGLRSLLKTMAHIPDMSEKTLRYPGHINYMLMLRESGFFNSESIDISGTKIRPIDVTARLLSKEWKLDSQEAEFTVMRVLIEGEEQGVKKKYHYAMLDEFDCESGISSMARTTGYACTGAARLVLEGVYDRKGTSPPEYVGADAECFHGFMNHLKQRGVVYRCQEE